jgi:flavodoxin
MKKLVVYDSLYGNTGLIATAIGRGLPGEVKVQRAGGTSPDELAGVDLLIVGTPTHGGRPTEALQALLDKIPADGLQGVSIAAFDTRFSWWWIKIFGFPAPRIAESLQGKGATLVVPPEGFIVRGRRGPLKDGETDRAAGWAEDVADKLT